MQRAILFLTAPIVASVFILLSLTYSLDVVRYQMSPQLPCRFSEVIPDVGTESFEHKDQRVAIALLLGGSIRSFVLPSVHTALKRNVIDAVEQDGVCKVHVLAHVSLEDATSWNQDTKFPLVTKETLQEAWDVLKPSSVSYYHARTLNVSVADILMRGCLRENDRYHLLDAAVAQYDVSHALYRQARSLETSLNLQFDWFIRTRPDYTWFGPIPLLQHVQRRAAERNVLVFDASWPWFVFDAFFMVDRGLADSMWRHDSEIFSKIPCAMLREETILNPEGLLAVVSKWLCAAAIPMDLSTSSTFAKFDGLQCPRSDKKRTWFANFENLKALRRCRSMDALYVRELLKWRIQ